jgi:hypothetical protein
VAEVSEGDRPSSLAARAGLQAVTNVLKKAFARKAAKSNASMERGLDAINDEAISFEEKAESEMAATRNSNEGTTSDGDGVGNDNMRDEEAIVGEATTTGEDEGGTTEVDETVMDGIERGSQMGIEEAMNERGDGRNATVAICNSKEKKGQQAHKKAKCRERQKVI